MLDHLRTGDIFTVYKLDRATCSLKDVLTLMKRSRRRKLGSGPFRS